MCQLPRTFDLKSGIKYSHGNLTGSTGNFLIESHTVILKLLSLKNIRIKM